MKPATQLLHSQTSLKDPYRSSVAPLYQSATFCQEAALTQGSYDYSRSGNPTRTELQEQVATLCGAHRAFCAMSHASIPEAEQKKKGFPTDLVRLSVGIEDADDLIADLTQALDSLTTVTPAEHLLSSYPDAQTPSSVQVAA